tara:strand:+ start:26 stop:637 length:612 start_codon:yes stop_codon:yes gene_type:complete
MEPAFKHPRFKREIPNNINDISKLFENFIDDKINEDLKVYISKDLRFSNTSKSCYLRLTIQYNVRNNDIIKLLCTHRINNLPIAFNNNILDFICDSVPGQKRLVWSGFRWTPASNSWMHNICMNMALRYPRDYPFRPPRYRLDSIITNSLNISYIREYIIGKIIQYNKCLNYDDWSPAYSITTEILGFMAHAEIKDLIKNLDY